MTRGSTSGISYMVVSSSSYSSSESASFPISNPSTWGCTCTFSNELSDVAIIVEKLFSIFLAEIAGCQPDHKFDWEGGTVVLTYSLERVKVWHWKTDDDQPTQDKCLETHDLYEI